jgi:hypothetical protein
MSSGVGNESQFFRDLYRLASRDLDTAEKIEAAVDIGRERLGLEYGVLSYTGHGQYEIVETNITTGKNAIRTRCRPRAKTFESRFSSAGSRTPP